MPPAWFSFLFWLTDRQTKWELDRKGQVRNDKHCSLWKMWCPHRKRTAQIHQPYALVANGINMEGLLWEIKVQTNLRMTLNNLLRFSFVFEITSFYKMPSLSVRINSFKVLNFIHWLINKNDFESEPLWTGWLMVKWMRILYLKR